MAYTKLLLIGVPATILLTVEATVQGVAWALPARTALLTWQVTLDADENVTVLLKVSMDGINWTTIDTITMTSGTSVVHTVAAPTSAPFVSAEVTVNVSEVEVMVDLIAKVPS